MADNSSNNNRIAKNSLYMAIRMVIVLLITLYTTRVVLKVLGVEDYGVYNVVCGFVSMFTFLNTSMSNGIQRFFNFELGKNGEEGANKVYNTALLIQFILAIIIIALTESFGMWYLHNKMVVPLNRMIAAEWIFQSSILSFLFTIMQAPYTAAVMAHERMDFFAVISVLDSILKLAIVFAIPYLPGDQLILYGVLFAAISVLNFNLYYIYCKRNFSEIKIRILFDRRLFRSMLGFSGWNIFGSLSGVMKEQGINLVINFFCGPVVNAARGVAQQINSGLQSFVQNITVPVRPQMVQAYAQGNETRAMNLTFSVSKFSCFLLYMMALPIIMEIDYILKIWLGDNIPEHTSAFVIIVIVTSFFNNLNAAISNVVHATGKMKKYQLTLGLIGISTVPCAFVAMRFGASPEMALLTTTVSMVIAQCFALVILKTLVSFSIVDYCKQVLNPFIMVVVISFFIPLLPHYLLEEGFLRLMIVAIVSLVSSIIAVLIIGLNSSEKSMLKGFINKVLKINVAN